MFSVTTEHSYGNYRTVFEDFDSNHLVLSDKLDLVKMYLEPKDYTAWNSENSEMRKKWNDFIVKEHSECKSWTAKKVTTVASPLETRVGYSQGCRVFTYTSSERENLRFFTLQVPEFQL